jgi:hypothetical protein
VMGSVEDRLLIATDAGRTLCDMEG